MVESWQLFNEKMRKPPRRRAHFTRKLKFLFDDILKSDFEVISCEIVHAYTDFDKFDFGIIKFSNGKDFLCPVSIFEKELNLHVLRELFKNYKAVKISVDIIDEPVGCRTLIQFHQHVRRYINYDSVMKNYYKNKIVPAFNSQISTQLTAIFGEEV